MALIECYECEKEISDKAPVCPHCGAPKEAQSPEPEEAEILESSVEDVSAQDQFQYLRELRQRLADADNMPAYIVCGDKTLRDLLLKRPTTKEELLEVHGFGPIRLEKHGDEFLAALRRFGPTLENNLVSRLVDLKRQIQSLEGECEGITEVIIQLLEQFPDPVVEGARPKGPSQHLSEMRKKHPRAWLRWEQEEKELLKEQFHQGRTLSELAEMFQRGEGAIKAQLFNTYGIDIQGETPGSITKPGPRYSKEEEVWHPVHGAGVVVKTHDHEYHGQVVTVEFPRGFQADVYASDPKFCKRRTEDP